MEFREDWEESLKRGLVDIKPSPRISFNKKTRYLIYQKTNGKCSYCGCDLELNKMQIDHIIPIDRWGTNNLENLLPSCRQCNFYKSTMSIEGFRKMVETIISRLEKLFIFKLAIKYKLIEVNNKKIVFEFEKCTEEQT